MAFLMTILQKSGLVVVQAANVQPGEHPKPSEVQITTMRVVSLKDLVGPQTATISGPKGFKATAEDVFAAAKLVEPENGWTAEKFRELAAKPLYRDMSPENRQKALLAELATNAVTPEQIVTDAVRKDEALDAYERFLQQRLAQTKKESAEKRKKLEAELAAVAEMEKSTEADFAAWQAAKRRKEAELAESLAPLMADGKITKS
ncbi:MAG: hypothetical protein HYY18_22130 [Planctomycetes bacterium]|nr:hypothetical protein [Planctomycetota bacterium]